MTAIDVIILSNAKNDELKTITLDCIRSLADSENEDEINFKTLVIESNREMKPYQYPGTQTIYPEATFGYNRYLNIGINLTSSDYVCLCNNDLIFHKGWASELIKVFRQYPQIGSANPFCPLFGYHEKIINGENVMWRRNTMDINGVVTGWCIFVKREILNKIGPLDERFTFWYADNDYDQTLRKNKVDHVLVKSSVVTHLGSKSHDLLEKRKEELTTGQWTVYADKWHKKKPLEKFLRKLFKR